MSINRKTAEELQPVEQSEAVETIGRGVYLQGLCMV